MTTITDVSPEFTTQIANILHDFNGTNENHEIFIPELSRSMGIALGKYVIECKFDSIDNNHTRRFYFDDDRQYKYVEFECTVKYNDNGCHEIRIHNFNHNKTNLNDCDQYDQCSKYFLLVVKLYCKYYNIKYLHFVRNIFSSINCKNFDTVFYITNMENGNRFLELKDE